jgi:4-amino-4-deoxy-L-arabinose transferase-like glycosyltransferase
MFALERLMTGATALGAAGRRRLALFVGTCVLAACAMNAGLLSAPIELWDESRNAVNALEMRQSGLSLITTYGFRPDLWNTKPPLLIWLMVASVRLFGVSEWALRLPSALAAFGTLAIVAGFSWRLTRSASTALLASILLATSYGFFGQHAAATGDYDVPLCFFTTAYVCLLFFTLHRRRPRPIAVLGAGALIAAAVLTKGVAALVPGVGIVIYLIATRRWARALLSPWYIVCALMVTLVVIGYYGLRETESAGYLSAVARNELGSRYITTIAGLDRRPWWYYSDMLFGRRGSFSAAALAVLAPFGLRWARNRVRLGLFYVLWIIAGVLVVFSSGATKHPWYLTPAYPFLAIGLALAINAGIGQAGKSPAFGERTRSLVRAYGQIGGALVVIALVIARLGYTEFWQYRHPSALPYEANYDALFDTLHRQGIREIRVVDGGVQNSEELVDYTPQLRFYALLWQAKGLTTLDVLPDMRAQLGHPGEIAATCDERYGDELRSRGEELASMRGCVAVKLRNMSLPIGGS